MQSILMAPPALSGRVRKDIVNGGFIQPQGGGKDVFVHILAVERAGSSSLNEGQGIEYEEVANIGKNIGRKSEGSTLILLTESLSVELVQQLLQSRLPCFVGRRHGVKKDRRLPYRVRSPSSIDLPLPRIRWGSFILHDNRVVAVVEATLVHECLVR
jgi:cold shock CspA family protein